MAANTKKEIQVYAHWLGLQEPSLMGVLSVSPAKGKESFSFEYAEAWLRSGFSQMIDPDLQLYAGAYYPRDDKPNFGIFLDSCPDRWGRVLMQRREASIAKQEDKKKKNTSRIACNTPHPRGNIQPPLCSIFFFYPDSGRLRFFFLGR